MVFNYYEVEQHLTFSTRNMGLKLENFNSNWVFCELRDLLLYSCDPWFKRLLLQGGHFTSYKPSNMVVWGVLILTRRRTFVLEGH